MLATSSVPESFTAWSADNGAPFGRTPTWWQRKLPRDSAAFIRARGAFAWQTNNTTRVYEYPWAYFQIANGQCPLNIVELGGGVAGLQFVLAAEGHRVINVDPGLSAAGVGFALPSQLHHRVCNALDAPVQLTSGTIGQADIPHESVDIVLSVSALEHFAQDDLDEVAACLPRLLKPQGILVSTVDLFMDLHPFCTATANDYGRNIDIHMFLENAELELAVGKREELYGFPEFDQDSILRNLSAYFLGDYPALTQCFVARRRSL